VEEWDERCNITVKKLVTTVHTDEFGKQTKEQEEEYFTPQTLDECKEILGQLGFFSELTERDIMRMLRQDQER